MDIPLYKPNVKVGQIRKHFAADGVCLVEITQIYPNKLCTFNRLCDGRCRSEAENWLFPLDDITRITCENCQWIDLELKIKEQYG